MTVQPEVAYVTACALGLAFSQHDRGDAVADLLAAAERCPETPRAARAALLTYPSQGQTVLLAADELLLSAEGAARLTAAAG